MFHWRIFLGGVFLAAAALSTLGTLLGPMLAGVLGTAVVAGRTAPIIEILGSLAAGLAAERLSTKSRS